MNFSKLKNIILNEATDCFIHGNFLIVDMPNRVRIKNIKNMREFVKLFDDKLSNEAKKLRSEAKEKSIRIVYSEEMIGTIKKNYKNLDFLEEELGIEKQILRSKVFRMRKAGEL